MLPESRLYSFIDQENGFTVHFLEGQKLISDLSVIHDIRGKGFEFYRDAVLTFQNMITYLKSGEALGIYLESEEPYFRLNLELNYEGQMRTLLLPEDFTIFPNIMNGRCRFVKLATGKTPYTSIVKLDNKTSEEVVNLILNESYQFQTNVFLSDESDQSVMIMKLPNKNVDKVELDNDMTPKEYYLTIKADVHKLFQSAAMEQSEIQSVFENKGLLFLGSKQIKFKCTCSEDRMFSGIRGIINSQGIDAVFAPDEDSIEAKCDYCKTKYIFSRASFLN